MILPVSPIFVQNPVAMVRGFLVLTRIVAVGLYLVRFPPIRSVVLLLSSEKGSL